MSAFVVSKEHIDLLIQAGLATPPDGEGYYTPGATISWGTPGRESRLNYTTAHEVGQMLVDANLASIHARYPDTLDGGPVPGPVEAYWNEPYHWRDPGYTMTCAETLKAIACFEYQACEFDGWEDSEAYGYCRALAQYVAAIIPGSREAPWEWKPERLAEAKQHGVARLTAS